MRNVNKTTKRLYNKTCKEHGAYYTEGLNNPICVNGDETTIYCVYKGKVYPVLIDTKAIGKLKKVHSWVVNLQSDKKRMVVVGNCEGKRVAMPDLLIKKPAGHHIDHINRLCNLRAVKPGINMLNKGDYSTNTSGTKNIIEKDGSYRVAFMRKFESLQLAIECQQAVKAILDEYSMMDAEGRRVNGKAV
jgi:hypothetical protein